MNHINNFLIFIVFSLMGSFALAQGAPEGATATCKDGSYYSGQSKRGACSRHGGVKEWYGSQASQGGAGREETAQQPMPATPPTSRSMQQEQQQPERPARVSRNTSSVGGNGQVWVNTNSRVYHCPGSRWYGKTKSGEYMSESQAQSQGIRADHNKSCQ